MNKKGFTLIELLVVMTVIAILMVISLVSLSGAQRQARDSQRKSDLRQYQVALEGYASSNDNAYPTLGETTDNTGGYISASYLCNDTDFDNYLTGDCLLDPVNAGTSQYIYWHTAEGYYYVLLSLLENGGCWAVCSNGKSGKVADAICSPTTEPVPFCPLN